MKKILQKVNVWNLVIGIVIGFSLGVTVINALLPNAGEMLRMCQIDPKSLEEERATRK